MKKKVSIASMTMGTLLCLTACAQTPTEVNLRRVVTNPIDLDYQYTARPKPMKPGALPNIPKMNANAKIDTTTTVCPKPEDVGNALAFYFANVEKNAKNIKVTGQRTAADPVAHYFKGKYYLFHSGANGYWSSTDMQHWHHINTNLPAGIAPAIMVRGDYIYYNTSHVNQLFRTKTPDDGFSWTADSIFPWKDDHQKGAHDPYLFADDDGKVYFYWECSFKDPIKVVELDPAKHFATMDEPDSIVGFNWDKLGYEVAGNRNERYYLGGFNEGSIMTKHNGKYYLQYATNGTEYDAYADGAYVADKPMGPFRLLETSPVSLKMGGFTTGAGHGDTFQDKYGNWWHLSSTRIGVRHNLERRISLFPMIFTPKGNLYALTAFADYPFELPDHKVDFAKDDIHTGWMNLTIGKHVTASSELAGFEANKAGDNHLRTWWSAKTGKPGEWLQTDLGHTCTLRAVQLNFADHNFGYLEDKHVPYQYVVEGSMDGKTWETLFDKRNNNTQNPHPLLVLSEPKDVRYIRVRNTIQLPGEFSMFELRAFGDGKGEKPAVTTIESLRRDPANRRRITISWKQNPNATGYLLRWGTDADELYTSMEVYGQTSVDLGCFNADLPYHFTIDAFNENGITKGKEVKTIK